MTVPLIVLSVGAVVLGALNLPFGDRFHVLEHWLEPSVHLGETTWKIPTGLEWGLEGVSIVLGLIGIFGAYLLYQKLTSTREEQLKYEPEILAKAWYYDLGITAFAGGPGRKFFDWVTFWFDRYIIDGAVNGTGRLVRFVAAKTRRLQTGYVRNYALGLAAGATCLLAFVVYRASF
jgi:NADH-quinone oxidoreductase subunit L